MENDDKIKKPEIIDTSLIEAKNFFLETESDQLEKNLEQKKVYFLEKELPKLKKNKNRLVQYLVIGFVFVFFLITLIGVRIIKAQEGGIQVGIEDFASINLSEVIKKMQSYRVGLEKVEFDLKRRNLELEEKIRIIEESQRIALSILKNKNLDIYQYRLENSKIKKRTLEEKKYAIDEYERQIAPLVRERKKIAGKIEVIEKQEDFKEKEETSLVVEQDINQLIKIRIEKIEENYQKEINEREKYYLNQKKKLEEQFSKVVQGVHEKYGRQINDYQNGFNRYINELGNVGVVLNVKNDKTFSLYIHPIYKVQRNAKAYIIDKKSKIKAEITINKEEDYFEGKVNKLFDKKNKVSPLDNVVLILK